MFLLKHSKYRNKAVILTLIGSILIFSIGMKLANTVTQQSSSENNSQMVYITKTGKKYHSAGCRYLRRSEISIKKSEAINEGYTACSVCNP
ncbi:hypothetical protein LL033_24720 (plasmid) [Clostridium estertheticum]|uniref:hypothetical protein n=1 Tax=Clostridium estertheticum TaxID=238834 RepID=UPI001C0CBBC6|nr:hypothetical protein [Clostridium estertheticum]MBU3217814.1 hypothetical protein [Clostridium estertheticum]WAG58331.1 hypothetical protein LL033_24720 [Clostridium estertheticum]